MFRCIIAWLVIKTTLCSIDMNAVELQYLADHLTPEECRKLVAIAHLKGVEESNVLDQAERTVSKDIPCIQLLNHWNSNPGEGKGETHEVLEHRLRQMGKDALADWLGKTVFHELGKDLNNTVEKGFKDFVRETTEETFIAGPTLAPIIENTDPTEWSPIDTTLYVTMCGLIALILFLCCKLCCRALLRWKKNRQKKKVTFKNIHNYDIMDESSGSESEEKFDVRTYSDKLISYTSSEGDT